MSENFYKFIFLFLIISGCSLNKENPKMLIESISFLSFKIDLFARIIKIRLTIAWDFTLSVWI